MWYLFYLYNFLISLALSLVLTRAAIFISRKWHIYDKPGGRKIHLNDMPRLGWLGMFGGFALTVLINAVILKLLENNPSFLNLIGTEIGFYIPGFYNKLPKLFGITAGGLFIVWLGLYDDKHGMSALNKLAGQIAAGLILVFFDIRITFFIPNYLVSVLLTVGWVVAVVNAFNLLDNMDGLSAGIALIVSLLFFSAVLSLNQFFVSSILSVFAGAVLGFLIFNFYPAKIFMGDAGSMFLGYMIAALTIVTTFYHGNAPTHFSVIMPLLILAVPIYDTISVILIRLKRGKPVYVGDKNHFSHRLVNLGMSQKGAVLFVYLVSFCAGVPALFLPSVNPAGAILIVVQTLCILSIIASLEFYGRERNNGRKNS